MNAVHIGCSGWNYADWRERFYPKGLPPKRWLARYAEVFDTVEINNTFYRLPTISAVQGWVDQTPPHFAFALKMSRYVTHIKRLTTVEEGVRRFYDSIEPLAGSPKMGPLVWQLPGNFKRDDDRLARALAALPPGRHGFEFRHESWFTDEVYDLLHRHGAALVIGDTPQRPFQSHVFTADWTLVRLHWGSRGRRGNYSHAELDEWAERIRRWRAGAEVFIYFNNDWEGFAIENGRYLQRRLS